MFGAPTAASLPKTGPYEQVKVPGILGESYDLPKVNPEDGSFMPRCAPGPCGHYSYSYDHRGRSTSHCDYHLEPVRVPQKTDWFAESPEKDRVSCAYNTNPIGLFSSDTPTYYVYWKEDPNKGMKQAETNKKQAQANQTQKQLKELQEQLAQMHKLQLLQQQYQSRLPNATQMQPRLPNASHISQLPIQQNPKQMLTTSTISGGKTKRTRNRKRKQSMKRLNK